jgi:uncharacterized protein (DUF885 family)
MMTQINAAANSAAYAWDQFATWLAQNYDVNEAVDRYAAGEREYEWRVHTVLRDPRSAAELYEYGAAQVALYTGKIFEVAKEFSDNAKLGLPFGTDAEKYSSVKRVMDFLSKDSPKNDEQLFKWYRDAGARAVAYGREHNLFDVPSSYRLDVVPTPPVLQSTIDAAYYPAPPFKKSGVGRFYLTPTGNNPEALKLNNFASVADTAIHEGFPGHDWHFKYMTGHKEQISNIRWLTPGAVEDSSAMWSDSMATEGWGLYSEELMSEPVPNHKYGFYSPGEYLYELQGQLLRGARIRVDVGLHTGRMTFDDAIDYALVRPPIRQRKQPSMLRLARSTAIQSGLHRQSPITSARTRSSSCARRARHGRDRRSRRRNSTSASCPRDRFLSRSSVIHSSRNADPHPRRRALLQSCVDSSCAWSRGIRCGDISRKCDSVAVPCEPHRR